MAKQTLLLVNKFYHDTGLAGGVGRYILQEEADLAAAGWQVVPFAVADPAARPSRWDSFFVTARDYTTPRLTTRAARDAFSLLWNREAARRLDELIRTVRPTVAHLHNIYHHLSPSILPVLARHRVPVVMTLHDLRLLCPAIHMLRRGEVCERCRGGRFFQAVLGGCVKDSLAASLLACLETYHHHLRRLYPRHVRRFLCPSRFYLEKYAAWGFPREKLSHLPNFVDTAEWCPGDEPPRNTYLYFGRISREKGLGTLLQAQSLWEAEDSAERPTPTLQIAGSGPGLPELERLHRELGLQKVEFLGPLAPAALRPILAGAGFTVIPSEWYENAPMAALESLAAGRPLVGTRLGGLAELIDDGRDGVLVPPGDPAALLAGLKRAAALGPEARTAARRKAESTASRQEHMQRLRRILVEAAG